MERKNTIDEHKQKQLNELHIRMIPTIERLTVGEENVQTIIPNLSLFRRDSPTQPSVCKVEPGLVIVVQGAKQLLVGDRTYAYDTNKFLINSLDVPANSQAIEASPEKPCLGLSLKLDFNTIADLIVEHNIPLRNSATDESSNLGEMSTHILEPCYRLLSLLDEPDSISALAPLIEREIHFRLLQTDQASRLWEISSLGSMSNRIARTIDWLRLNYAKPFRIEELAAHVQMSPSNLHLHFRQHTTMTPLQYQKWLRLHEARSLMLNERLDAATASFRVGYESASQFSREYGRLFGSPPKRDIEDLRQRVNNKNSV